MVLEQIDRPEPGVCRLVFRASAEELAQAAAQERAARPEAAQDEDGVMTAAVNRAILGGLSPLYEQAVRQEKLTPITDPDLSLLAVDPQEGFRAQAEFFVLPPLELGPYTGYVASVKPRPIRQVTLELEINRHHSAEDRAADAEGKAALRRRVAQEMHEQRCAQAWSRAEQELVDKLGSEVSGPLPKQLVAGNYFAEQRRFNLRMQAQGVNFDQYLAVRGQTVEQFRQELHAQAEQRLRSRLGLLLVADKEGLWPAEAEVEQAVAAWDEKKDGPRTFPANDARKMRQQIAARRAAAYIVSAGTLLPPPSEPVILAPGEVYKEL